MSREKCASITDGAKLGCLLLGIILPQLAFGEAVPAGPPGGGERAVGDMDMDSDVDFADFALVQACYGVIESPPDDGCPVGRLALLDGDGDGSLNASEFEQFAACMSGPNQPAPPQCLQPALAVSIMGPSTAEDGRSVDLVASVTGGIGTVLFDWQLLAGSAVLDDRAVMDPTLWMTADEDVLVGVTIRDVASNGITIDTVVDQHSITAVPHPQYTFEVFAGGDRVLVASTMSTIDLFGAYFDPAACPQQAIYWQWDAVSIPLPEGGWFDKVHRLGTPSEPVRFTPLGSWIPGDYVFSLFAHNSCSNLEDQDTVVVSLRAECINDEECHDGIFCNGLEYCDADGICQPGSNPCSPGNFCDEPSDTCGPPIGQTLTFTLEIDTLTGGSGDDAFNAPLAFNPALGVLTPTLQNGDSADGLGGTDTLNATYVNPGAADVTLPPTLSGIEILNLTDLGPDSFAYFLAGSGTAVSGTNISGVMTINNQSSFANVTVTNLNALTDLGITNSDFDLNVSYVSPAGSGAADTHTLTLNGSRDSDQATDGADFAGSAVNFTTPVNGFETLNVVSTGSMPNFLEALIQTTGTTLTTMNVSGSALLIIRRYPPLPGTLTTINASSAQSGVDLTVGGAGLGVDVTFTGGAGNDVINFAGTYTSADTINGAGGTNTLGLNSAQAVSAASTQNNVTGIQTILIPDSLGGNVDVTRFGASPATAATDAILDTTFANTPLTVSASVVTLGTGNRNIRLNNDDTAHNMGATISGVGTADTLTVNLNNADLALTFTATGGETVNLVSGNGLDGTAADGNANTAVNVTVTPTIGTGTLQISGAVATTITGAVTVGSITAAGASAALTMETESASTTATSVSGSAFNDELVGGAGNEGIAGNDGNDQIKGLAGADVVTGGNGADHFVYDATSQFGDTIADMTAGTDNVALGSGLINFPGIAGTEAAPVELTVANFETGRATISAVAAGDTLKIVRISSEQTTDQIQNGAGAAIVAYVLVFDSALQRGVLYHDPDWSNAAARTLVARFESITTNAGVQALTFADFEEID